MQLLTAIDEIFARYDALFCDVWGVIHNGRASFPAAAAALQRARRTGKRVILLTNVPKPRGPIPAQFDRLGFPRDAYDAIVTSGDAIRAELAVRAPGPMYKIGPDSDYSLWEGLGISFGPLAQARFIGISGLNDYREAPHDYTETLKAARARDLEMLCANPDIVVRVGDNLIWCAGAIARDYEHLGGRVVMAGKPHRPIYDLAYKELETLTRKAVDKSKILCIGDGVTTDIRGANGEDLDSLFIASGMHGETLHTNGALDPAKLEEALAAGSARANFAMGALT